MRRMAMMLLMAANIRAGERSIDVCMDSHNDVQVTTPARRLASEIFARAGVTVHWRTGSRCPSSAGAIRITLTDEVPKGIAAGALAYALPYEGTHIVVFYDRVAAQHIPPRTLLGYVMAHEITHMIQEVSRHSATGIMKAHWTPADYYEMITQKLDFAEVDVLLLQAGAERRAARATGQTAMLASAR
jgi:hypothetical protein